MPNVYYARLHVYKCIEVVVLMLLPFSCHHSPAYSCTLHHCMLSV